MENQEELTDEQRIALLREASVHMAEAKKLIEKAGCELCYDDGNGGGFLVVKPECVTFDGEDRGQSDAEFLEACPVILTFNSHYCDEYEDNRVANVPKWWRSIRAKVKRAFR